MENQIENSTYLLYEYYYNFHAPNRIVFSDLLE